MAAMLEALQQSGVTMLVDIRQSPCASDPTSRTNYSAQDWNLQFEGGIENRLSERGIQYQWLIELGNPQKRDRTMKIMRDHLESNDERWPVVRGLRILADLVHNDDLSCCLLCACAEYRACHRHLIAETLNARYFQNGLEIVDLGKSGPNRQP